MKNNKQKLLEEIKAIEEKIKSNEEVNVNIEQLKKTVNDIQEYNIDEVIKHLPSRWVNYITTGTSIITVMLLVIKTIWDHYQKIQINLNLDSMMKKVEGNLKKKK